MSEPTGKHYRIETIADIVDSDIPDDRIRVVLMDFAKVIFGVRNLADDGLRDAWPGYFTFIDDDEGTVELNSVDAEEKE